jgi:uncharacterized damage-inducible protein DinB
MPRPFPTLVLLSFCILPSALTPSRAAAQAAPAADNASVAAVHSLWKSLTDYITQSAKDMPEEKYGFQPTPEVRTFGQLIGHVAGAQRMFCAIALGEPPTAESDIEKTVTTKAGLIAAMESSSAYCERAYAQTDAATRAPVTLFGQKVSRFYALAMNATHNGEHYGNIVTYLRINGIVPPSSRRGM